MPDSSRGRFSEDKRHRTGEKLSMRRILHPSDLISSDSFSETPSFRYPECRVRNSVRGKFCESVYISARGLYNAAVFRMSIVFFGHIDLVPSPGNGGFNANMAVLRGVGKADTQRDITVSFIVLKVFHACCVSVC